MSSAQNHVSGVTVQNWSQFVTSSSRHRGKAYRPWAFTEHGAIMAANILDSEQTIHMNVFVVWAGVCLREYISVLLDLYEKSLPLLQLPLDPPERRIGFDQGNK